jgi:hypothetical protein
MNKFTLVYGIKRLIFGHRVHFSESRIETTSTAGIHFLQKIPSKVEVMLNTFLKLCVHAEEFSPPTGRPQTVDFHCCLLNM